MTGILIQTQRVATTIIKANTVTADSNDKDNYIDFNKGTITVDGKTYSEEDMQLLHENNHIYLIVEEQKILIKWLDDCIGVPYIY